MIARIWRGVIRTPDRDPYVRYVLDTGVDEYRRTAGNLSAHVLTRELPDGLTEVLALSLWTTEDAVRAFAGDDITAAVLYREDRRYLVNEKTTITHYEVHPSADPSS